MRIYPTLISIFENSGKKCSPLGYQEMQIEDPGSYIFGVLIFITFFCLD